MKGGRGKWYVGREKRKEGEGEKKELVKVSSQVWAMGGLKDESKANL